MCDIESLARSFANLLRCEERVEDLVTYLLWDAATCVRYDDFDLIPVAACCDRDRAALPGVLDGVRRVDDEVQEHLANLANRFCTLPIYEQYKHQKRINTLAYPDAILFACRVGIHEPQTHSNPQGLTPQPVSLQ